MYIYILATDKVVSDLNKYDLLQQDLRKQQMLLLQTISSMVY